MKGTLYWKKHRPLDETLNRVPDSLRSLKIPGCPSKKSRGVTLAKLAHWPLTIMASPYTDWLHHSVSSPPISWCVVGVLAHYGCRRIIQVDAAHWWWMRRSPPYYVKRFECLEKRYINVTNYYYRFTPLLTTPFCLICVLTSACLLQLLIKLQMDPSLSDESLHWSDILFAFL